MDNQLMLDRFRKAKEQEIALLKTIEAAQGLPTPYQGLRPSFTGALRSTPVSVIAEYKRASPSKGDINLGFSPEEIAHAYAEAGAGAISVLTEADYFKGDLSFLFRMTTPGLSLLRKDFIFDPLQVAATAATPASAMLLIVRMLDDAMLEKLIAQSISYGIEPVVEVFSMEDLLRAKAAGATIVQVNNRDLDTLQVDDAISARLVRHKAPHEFWITASGINTADDLKRLLALGFDAALVGSSLMSGEHPGKALAKLLQFSEHPHDRHND